MKEEEKTKRGVRTNMVKVFFGFVFLRPDLASTKTPYETVQNLSRSCEQCSERSVKVFICKRERERERERERINKGTQLQNLRNTLTLQTLK
jgi:hypothetical protein